MKRAVAAVLGVLAAITSGCSAGQSVATEPVGRVLVISLPGAHWADVRSGHMPNLARFVRHAAVGDLATRIGRKPTTAADAYLSMSAGTRAVAPTLEPGAAFDAQESYGAVPAGEVFRRRTADRAKGIGYLSIGTAAEVNAASRYGARIGLLGDRLAEAEVARAVIANADRPEPDEVIAVDRSAATALMDSDGLVPDGSVRRDLRLTDGRAPYGTRLDRDVTLDAFDAVWRGRRGPRIVLVETSDLARAHGYRDVAAPEQYRKLRSNALADSDKLIGELLARVDGDRDAVVVLSPVAPPGAPALGVVALRAPTTDGGLLRSATTRRDGYVQLADVTPTLLSLVGVRPPSDIEGRPFRVGGGTDDDDHLDVLAAAVADAHFRDDIVPAVVLSFVAVLVLMTLAFLFRSRIPDQAQSALRPLALSTLGAIPATYVAGAVGFLSGNLVAYAAFVIVFAAGVAAVATVIDKRWPGTALIVALGAIVVVIGGDVARGAPLQLNTVFGYSVAVAGRFAGLGNLAFALLAPSALLCAVALARRFGRPGVSLAVALLVGVVLLDGLPFFGADVGGVLSMVPAFAVCALSLLGRRVRWQTVVGAFTLAVFTVLTFAFFDLARPPAARTHLARIAEHVVDLRWAPIANSLSRRWQASFGTPSLAAWAALAVVVVSVGVYLLVVDARHRRADAAVGDASIQFAVPGLVLLAGLGLLANDSSFAVPGAMLIVVAPAAILHLDRTPSPAPERVR